MLLFFLEFSQLNRLVFRLYHHRVCSPVNLIFFHLSISDVPRLISSFGKDIRLQIQQMQFPVVARSEESTSKTCNPGHYQPVSFQNTVNNISFSSGYSRSGPSAINRLISINLMWLSITIWKAAKMAKW